MEYIFKLDSVYRLCFNFFIIICFGRFYTWQQVKGFVQTNNPLLFWHLESGQFQGFFTSISCIQLLQMSV